LLTNTVNKERSWNKKYATYWTILLVLLCHHFLTIFKYFINAELHVLTKSGHHQIPSSCTLVIIHLNTNTDF
jgi:hypothetical protein